MASTIPRVRNCLRLDRLALVIASLSLASCDWLTRPPPTPMAGPYPWAPTSASADGPPQHVITAARENLTVSTGGPSCLDPLAQGPSARQRCAALGLSGPRLVCESACVRRHLPDEAERARAGGLVAVRFSLDAEGRFARVTSLHEPGCGLGRAAPEALRVCCSLAEDGSTDAGVDGCHVVEFTSAR